MIGWLTLGYLFYLCTKPNSGLQYTLIWRLRLSSKEDIIDSRKQTKFPLGKHFQYCQSEFYSSFLLHRTHISHRRNFIISITVDAIGWKEERWCNPYTQEYNMSSPWWSDLHMPQITWLNHEWVWGLRPDQNIRDTIKPVCQKLEIINK